MYKGKPMKVRYVVYKPLKTQKELDEEHLIKYKKRIAKGKVWNYHDHKIKHGGKWISEFEIWRKHIKKRDARIRATKKLREDRMRALLEIEVRKEQERLEMIK